MEESRQPKELALDTNLVLDLADEAEFAHAFKEVFQEHNYALRLPPTVISELHENLIRGQSPRKRELSRVALLNARAGAFAPSSFRRSKRRLRNASRSGWRTVASCRPRNSTTQ